MKLWCLRSGDVVMEDVGASCCVGVVRSVFSGVGVLDCGVWLEECGLRGHSSRLVVRGGGMEWHVCVFGYAGVRVSKGDILWPLYRGGFGDCVRFVSWYVGGSDFER